jgi:CheY-like chemotaxis protein
VVDDNADARESVALLVEMNGHQVYRAGDGETALALAGKHPPDVALLDVGLPGMSGYVLAERLRELSLPRKPFLIAVTGYGADEDRAHCRKAGFALHLVKPVEPEVLESVLRAAAHLQGAGRYHAQPPASNAHP